MRSPVDGVARAEGIDVSAYQLDLTVHDLAGLSFAFTKATDGPSATDPHFAANWAAIKAAGLHRGTYHELQAGAPVGQAVHFLATVKAQGLQPGDMLAVVASDYPGVTDTDVLTWCGTVHAGTRGHNPVLAYTDLSVGATLTRTSAAGYGLWAAWPNPVPPGPLANWRTWRLWQFGTRFVPGLGGVDADAYNGTAADMGAWIASYQPPPPKPHLTTRTGDTMFTLPNGAGAVVALPVPAAVLVPDGITQVVAPTVIQFASNAPASLEYMLGNTGTWIPLAIDYARSPVQVNLSGASVVKVQRVDAGTNLVTGDFA